jgi:hypothetical protein
VKRLITRLSGLVAFAGLVGTDVLSGIVGNHAETLLRDED